MEIRSLKKLLAEKPFNRRGEMVIMVNAEEGRILATAGASISSGSENLERNTQHYTLNGKTYLWLAGYPDGNWDDEFPVKDAVCPRLREVIDTVKSLG